MTYKGGSVLFRNPHTDIKDIKKQIEAIFLLEPQIEILVQQVNQIVVIYKLIFKEPLSNFFFGLSLSTPRVTSYVFPNILIVKYSYDTPDQEAQVQSKIAPSIVKSNLFPIAPTIIYSEYLKFDHTTNQYTTSIGRLFENLLKTHNLQARLVAFISEYIAKTKNKALPEGSRERIMIMEMIDGETLQTLMAKIPTIIPKFIVSRQTSSITLNKMFLQNFFTFYLSTLSAFKGVCHGDPHMSNIMLATGAVPFFIGNRNSLLEYIGSILTKYQVNRVPYIIDFGRGAHLAEMEFQKFTEAQQEVMVEHAPFYMQIYYELYNELSRSVKPIKDIIEDYIWFKTKYVEAILILTMCGNATYDSTFALSYNKSTLYNHLYQVTEAEAQLLNILLKEAFNERTNIEAELTQLQPPSELKQEDLIQPQSTQELLQQHQLTQPQPQYQVQLTQHQPQYQYQDQQTLQNQIDKYGYVDLSNIHPDLHRWYIEYLYMKYKSYNIKEQECMRNNIDHTLWGKLVNMMMHTTGGRYRYTKHRKKNQKKINKTQKPKKSKKPKKPKKIKTRKL